MKTDFRSLCAELADAYLRTLEHINNSTWLGYEPSDDPLLQRARASLADEPAEPAPPADGEVVEVVEWLREQLHVCLQAPWTPGIKYFGRAAELLERQATACAICERERLHQSTRAADLEVERQAAPVPVPVNERLPGPKDCDAEGRCWWGTPSFVNRSSVTQSAQWRLSAPDDRFGSELFWCHAHALPQPEVGE